MSVPSSIVCFKQIDSYGLILARQSLGGMKGQKSLRFHKKYLRSCTHGDTFSCIRKCFVSYLRFVQTDQVFWESETAVF